MKTQIPYLQAYDAFFRSTHRNCLLYGGAGSGKSVAAAQKLFIRCLQEPGARILVVRKTERALGRSVYALLEQVIRQAGLTEKVRFARGQEKAIRFWNGSEILFTGCFDADRHKSIQGITSIWVEEATELTEHDYEQLVLRVRGQTPGYKQFLLTFNPTDQSHWLYNRFFNLQSTDSPPLKGGVAAGRGGSKKAKSPKTGTPSPWGRGKGLGVSPEGGGPNEPGADCFILRTTFRDNALLDAAYKRHLGETLRRDPNLFRIYAMGEWGHLKRGGEFYKHFDMAKHVAPVAYKKTLPLHISFDFNLNPYMTLTVWQAEGKQLRQIDEICLSNPDNSTPALCKAFLDRYGRHQAGVNIYGDPTGAKGNTQTAARASDYNVIQRELAGLDPRMMVRASAPEVALRGQFINRLLMGAVEGVTIKLDPRCANTIQDYQNLQEHADGSKIKEMHTDKNGVRSQKHGHCSDANDYLLCRMLEKEYRAMLRGPGGLPKAVIGFDGSPETSLYHRP